MSDSDEDIEEITSKDSSAGMKPKDMDADVDVSSSTESDVSEKHLGPSTSDTGHGHTVSLDTDIGNVMKLQKQLHSLQRSLDKEHRLKVSLDNKCQSLETQKTELNNKLAGLMRDKRTLEETKIELEAKLRSLQVTVSTEQQKRANSDIIIARIKEQLVRSEDQCKMETESKEKLEIVVRNLRGQLEDARQALNQVEAEKEDAIKQLETGGWLKSVSIQGEEQSRLVPLSSDSDDVSQNGSTDIQFAAELAALKTQMEQQMRDDADEKQRVMEENDLLRKQIAQFKQDLDLDAKTLAETTVRDNLEIGTLNAKLQEALLLVDKHQAELAQCKQLLDVRTAELDEFQRKCSEVEKQCKRQLDDVEQKYEENRKLLAKSKEDSDNLAAKLSETEVKYSEALNKLKVLSSTSEERANYYADLQKQLNNEQKQCEELRDKLRAEQELGIHSKMKIETMEQRLLGLQDEVASLHRAAEEVKQQNDKQSEQLMSVIGTLKEDHLQEQNELRGKNEMLESKTEELLKTLLDVETQRDKLRAELTSALADLEDSQQKLTRTTQSKNNLEAECAELERRLQSSEHELELAKNRQNEVEMKSKQLASALETVQSDVVDNSDTLRAKQAAFESAIRLIAENNGKLNEIVSQPKPVDNSWQAGVVRQTSILSDDGCDDVSHPAQSGNGHRHTKHVKKKDLTTANPKIDALEKQIAMLKLHLQSVNKRLKKSQNPADSNLSQLQKQAHHLMNHLRRTNSLNKNHTMPDMDNVVYGRLPQEVVGQEPSDNSDWRAELEMRIRLELNKKLARLNSFLQQHSEECEKIDKLRDANEDEIRQQMKNAERDLRDQLTSVLPSIQLLVDSAEQNGAGELVVDTSKLNDQDDMKLSQSMDLTDFYDVERPQNVIANAGRHAEDQHRHIETRDEALLTRLQVKSFLTDGVKMSEVSPSFSVQSSAVNGHLPLWLQKQLDRSIAKHLEKAPHVQLATVQYSSDQFASSSFPEHSSGYTSALERNYLLT